MWGVTFIIIANISLICRKRCIILMKNVNNKNIFELIKK